MYRIVYNFFWNVCKNNKMKMAYEFEKEQYNMDLGQEREGGK